MTERTALIIDIIEKVLYTVILVCAVLLIIGALLGARMTQLGMIAAGVYIGYDAYDRLRGGT